MERREDITLGSLRRFVAALGAELEINIKTPEGKGYRLSGPEDVKLHRAACSHVEERLGHGDTAAAKRSIDKCKEWLAGFEGEARSRWELSARSLCFSRYGAGKSLSWALPELGTVCIDFEMAGRLHALRSERGPGPAKGDEGSFDAVLFHLLAHEVGHFVDVRKDPALRQLEHEELKADAVAGWLAGQEGRDPLFGSELSMFLGCKVKACSHPPPEERMMAYLTGYSEGSRRSTPVAQMRLVVVRVSDLQRSRSFYETLGLSLKPERHRDGPLHYSSDIGGTVLELYPSNARSGGLRLGFQLPEVRSVVDRLVASGSLTKDPVWRPRDQGAMACVVRDPDDNAVELEEGAWGACPALSSRSRVVTSSA
jgi:catechol 2,3-dioxygenase-like lactoylglutathione lyase family enzyme